MTVAAFARRVSAWVAAALLTACAGSAPPQGYPPLTFDYLPPIGLNVATVDVEQRFVPGGPNDASALSPVDPVATLRALATARLKPFGATGRAVVAIKDASLTRRGGVSAGQFVLEVDVFAPGAANPSGFAEARVFRQTDSGDGARTVLYDLVKQLSDAMNVELEYQVRNTLRDWVAVGPGSQPAAVEATPLPPPGSAAGAPLPGVPAAPSAPGYGYPPAPAPTYPPAPAPAYPSPSTPPYSGAPYPSAPYPGTSSGPPPSQGY